MKTIIEIIKEDFIIAFKSKETLKKNVLWVIKTKVTLFEKEKWAVKDADVYKIIKNEVKEIWKTLASITEWTALYNQAVAEKAILEAYLPEDMSDEEVIKIVIDFIKDNNLEQKDFWRIMWTISKQLNGLYDNSKLKDIIQDILNKKS